MRTTDFILYSPAHWAILAATPLLAWFLVRLARRRLRPVRVALGWFLIVNELTWYAYRLRLEGFRFPEGLPLELCDVTLWLTAAAALTLNRWAFEVAYFAGVGGAAMALLTPDLWAPAWSYPTFYFFATHSFVVITPVVLAATGALPVTASSMGRALAMVNLYAAAVGAFNLVFHTNYMYLCSKPDVPSLLDLFGSWPWYLLGGELAALMVFVALYLPFHLGNRYAPQG